MFLMGIKKALAKRQPVLLTSLLTVGGLWAFWAFVGAWDKRYFTLVVSPFWLVTVSSVVQISKWLAGQSRGRQATLALASFMLTSLLVVDTLSLINPRWYAQRTDIVHVAVAEWVSRHIPPGDVIATEEIGVLGYMTSNPILDMVGLISPEAGKYPTPEGRLAWIKNKRPDYLVASGNPFGIVSVLKEEGVAREVYRAEFCHYRTIYTRSFRTFYPALSPNCYVKTIYQLAW
jgi:hypothetical protein